MPTYRFPTLIWQDPAGGFTAALVESDEEPAGFGATADAAKDQLQNYLQWAYQREPYRWRPDFLDAALQVFKVSLRPEYKEHGRVYPCERTLVLRAHCVSGRQESGLLVASLPLVGVRFYYHDADALPGLVQRYVKQQLEGHTPEELARHLPPADVRLEEVVVRLPRKEVESDDVPAPPTLGRVAEPLGDRALRKQFGRAWEREAEAASLAEKLFAEKANVLLVGEPGSGKTTLLVEAVGAVEKRLADEEAGERRKARPTRRYWLTSAGRLIAGMKYLGQWEQRLETVIAELADVRGVLCVDRLLDLLRAGGIDATDSLAAFLLPFVQRGEVRVVGEATPAELDACRRLLPGFADLFQVVPVPPFDRRRALAVLDRLLTAQRQNLHLEVAPGVGDRVYQLFRRFAPYQVFPGPAVAFTRDLCERAARARVAELTPAHVVERFMRQTGLPELFLRDELALARDEVLAEFRRQVIDQEEAVAAAANLVMTFKAGLNDPNRPVGVLLFCGPTGVGKTELAQTLARYFFGHGEGGSAKRLVRLDMSEYAGFGAAERLLGPPQGEPSELIRKLRQQPFTVLLFDEIEKASPEVFDVLLGVFDEGRLTDRFGRVTTFRSTIIILTSNLGAGKAGAFGFAGGGPAKGPDYVDEAMRFFRPEFFNRLDAVVTFQPLGPATVEKITRKELEAIAGREGVVRAGNKVVWADGLVAWLAKTGFDARYGARPLQRTLEGEVVAPLAKFLLERPELRGATIEADGGEGGVRFRMG